MEEKKKNGANLGFEEKLWQAADKLRGNMDAAEYKHVVLGLIFLKYISDAFEEKYADLKSREETEFTDPEDPDEYLADNIFWVPAKARWSNIKTSAKKPEIGRIIDEAMEALEKENDTLAGVLTKDYSRESLDKRRLGELIDLISTIGLGDKESQTKDVLGRVYEYFLGKFADAEGKNGGQFYTAKCIVELLVEMIEPYKGRILDPCCGSGGMFVQSEKFIQSHGGRRTDVSIYGQESNSTTVKLAKMNMAIRQIDAKIEYGDSFHNDKFKDLRVDYLLANPPFNDSDWGGNSLRDDVRWKFGIPPAGNANYAWIQHFISHLAPNGIAGFVMANGSLSSNQSGEGDIRKNIIEADLVDCIVALPGQLFYNTMIPVCLWFVYRDRQNNKFRDRRGETLFMDARKLGEMIDRKHKTLTEEDIKKIADTYHTWRGEMASMETGQTLLAAEQSTIENYLKESGEREEPEGYEDIPGFCKTATIDEIRKNGYILTPGRYVGMEEIEDDGIPFEEKMAELSATLYEQFAEAARLEAAIKRNLEVLGYGQ
ncbi:MAG TPA: class I SAM-dependent DNA methyltransferase [Mesotoga sp.]|nr:class I SAM-dependent DNA methyltransferase [Mesotoga sp.]HOY26412.1 class I SAM-dependent DNA methyltransferase [Mesotoga sp.]HPI18569.1 class I SAM-dependent DNA methyltransferase [Mesotoga sp.]HPM96213.1 class I SAM-dependent DNA methyltransferase [Mesotoga sp.]